MSFSPLDIPPIPPKGFSGLSSPPSKPQTLGPKTSARPTSSTGLLNRRTDLKSLKFGTDRRGGGASGHPYFVKDIPDTLSNSTFPVGIGSTFLLRNGFFSTVPEDQIRLSNYFKGPQGLLFVAKQNLLARQNSATGAQPTRFYTPLNTLAQAAVNSTGLHLMKDGTNFTIDDQDKYFGLNKPTGQYHTTGLGKNNKNRLLLLYETNLITSPVGQAESSMFAASSAANAEATIMEGSGTYGRRGLLHASRNTEKLSNDADLKANTAKAFKANLSIYGVSLDPNKLLEYTGGPNAALGGKSQVRKVFNTNDGFNRNKNSSTDALKYLTYSPDQLKNRVLVHGPSSVTGTSFQAGGMKNFQLDLLTGREQTGVSLKRIKQLIGTPTDYSKFNREDHLGESTPGRRGRDKSVYYTTPLKETKRGDAGKIYEFDRVNAQRLYSSQNVGYAKEVDKDGKSYLSEVQTDAIKFHIGAVNIDNATQGDLVWIHFRAYIQNFTDNYNADWQSYNYMGRGNSYYRYNGYNRKISMGFEVAVHSKYEQAFVYSKLNYLASLLAPNYSNNTQFMRGNIIKLTMGDYLNNTYGILNSLSYSIPEDSSWDIAKNNQGRQDKNSLELPMRISVTGFEFTPIHNFYDSTVSTISNTPDQRFISLGEDGKGYENALA